MKLLEESLILILSFIVILIFTLGNLYEFTPPFLGFIIAVYLMLSLRKRGKGFLYLGGDGPWGVFLLNIIIFILIFSLGSINSPVFFLIYFLAFAIAFIFEPITIVVFVIGGILVFLPDIAKLDIVANILKLSSIVLIAPLAFFFGKQYRRQDQEEAEISELKERTNDAANTISKDIQKVLKSEKQTLKEEDVEKLNEVLEETEDLREESKL